MSDYWSWNNAVDGNGSTIESSEGSAGDLVVGNLRDPRVGKIWRAGDMPVTLTINLAASSGISIIGVFGVNLPEMTTFDLELFDGEDSVWADSVSNFTTNQCVFVMRTEEFELEPVNASQLVITATGTIPLEIGRVWVGTADWEPEVGHVVDGSSRRVIDLSNVTRAATTGARISDINSRLRTFTAAYDALTQDEFDEVLYKIDVERGMSGQFLFVPEPEIYALSRWPILGGLVELEETVFTASLTGGRSLTIQEDG